VAEGNKRITGAFGAAVRAIRLRRNMSQLELAERCELERTYLSDIERGSRNPTLVSIWRIAAGLQIRPSELLQEAESLSASINHE